MGLHGGTGAPEGRTGSAVLSQAQPNVLSLPSRWETHQPAGAGLNNLGNSCYLNSTLQCLAYVPPLGYLCLTRSHSISCPRGHSSMGLGPAAATRPGGPLAPCTFCLIERQLSALLRGSRSAAISPLEVVRHLHLFSRSFVKGRQEDSHELLTAVLDVLERDGRRAAMAMGAAKGCRTIVEDLFLGRWQSQVRCLACGHESNTYETFATLPLDIGQARTVVEGLRAFTEAERLDGNNKYRCDRCRQLVPAIKQTTIWDDPNVLVVHLKRFDATSLLGKITRHVAFPETVDLQPFMTPPGARCRAEQQHQQALLLQQKQQHHHGPLAGLGNAHAGDHGHRQDPQPHLDAGSGEDADPAANGNGTASHHHNKHHHHHHHPHQHQHQRQQHLGHQQKQLRHHDHDPGPDPDGPYGGGGGGFGSSTYRLTGVLVHQGTSLHSGHYYAFVRDSSDGWSCMNDSQVYGTSLEQVRQEQAYLLFYTRHTMKLPRPTPVTQPSLEPASAPAATAAVVAGPAPVLRLVYGPQLPPHLARTSVNGSAATTITTGTITVATPTTGGGGGGDGSSLPARPSRVAPAAAPTARLPAKVRISPRSSASGTNGASAPGLAQSGLSPSANPPAAPAAGPTSAMPRAEPSASGPRSGPSTSAVHAASGAGPVAETGPGSESRKRKRPDEGGPAEPAGVGESEGGGATAASGTGATAMAGTGATAVVGGGGCSRSDVFRAAVEEEVQAHKACASWGEGVKRLRTSVAGLLRESEWLGQARAALLSMKHAGLSLQEVLATGRSDGRRRGLDRAVPSLVLRYGTEELRKMLRSLLSLGWLGGVVPIVL